MGKSSLYVQHLSALREQGFKPIIIDIAAQVDREPTGVGWINSLGQTLAAELGLDDDAFATPLKASSENAAVGTALEHLLVDGLLKHCNEKVFLVLDEYDCIWDLDYCDQVLFALRHIQSVQARTSKLDRLSVCLVGLKPLTALGTPGAANTSPFAIPIEMLDFKNDKTTLNALGRGFSKEARPNVATLRRVLELSGGQPLVTMHLLSELKKHSSRTVDALAKDMVADSGLGKDLQLFESIERSFVAEGANGFSALRAYEALLKGSREAHSAPAANLLSLFGLVRRKKERLQIKGDLFRRRFDEAWVGRTLSSIASRMGQYRGGDKHKGKKICVINTGGTIGMVERNGKVVAPKDAQEFKDYFKSLGDIAEVVEFFNLFTRDSINVFPDQWVTIAKYIYNRRHDGFDGFVVAHGTDTMAYSASAVAFALGPQLRFPVVFTGAQTTPDVAYGDAHVNLYRACEVAQKEIPEVVISFGNFVYRAVRAQKKDDRRFDGFESPTYPPLAEITGEITVRQELLRRLPEEVEDINLKAQFETSILIVAQFPGLEPGFFEHLLRGGVGRQGCRGIIVQTLGAGNVASEPPYSFIPFVQRAYRQGIPVIVTSQYPPDPGTHTKYTPAEAPITAGAIHAGNMTLAAAVAKFRWVLADVFRRKGWSRMSPEGKRKLVSKLMVEESVVGEF